MGFTNAQLVLSRSLVVTFYGDSSLCALVWVTSYGGLWLLFW